MEECAKVRTAATKVCHTFDFCGPRPPGPFPMGRDNPLPPIGLFQSSLTNPQTDPRGSTRETRGPLKVRQHFSSPEVYSACGVAVRIWRSCSQTIWQSLAAFRGQHECTGEAQKEFCLEFPTPHAHWKRFILFAQQNALPALIPLSRLLPCRSF